MPNYQIICETKGRESFLIPQSKMETSEHSAMSLIKWQDKDIRQNALKNVAVLNKQGISCIYHQKIAVKAIFFDMDSTAIGQETIVELARCAGTSKEVAHITEEAMSGNLDFAQALHQRVATLEGLTLDQIETVHDRLTINPGLFELSRVCQVNSIELFLISGGFNRFAQRIAEKLAFTSYQANELEFINGKLTGKVIGPLIDSKAKKDFLLKTCRDRGYSPKNVIAVGDGANDLEMLSVAGIKIGYNPKPILLDSINGAIFDSHLPLIDIVSP